MLAVDIERSSGFKMFKHYLALYLPPVDQQIVSHQQRFKPAPWINTIALLHTAAPKTHTNHISLANHNDLTRGHLRWWFGKGILPEIS